MDQEKENKEGIDLSGAPKDSDTGVKLQNGERQPTQTFFPGTPKIIRWVIKYSGGLVKDEKQASYVLIGLAVVAIIVSLFLIFGGGEKQEIFTPEAEAPAEEVMPPAEF